MPTARVIRAQRQVALTCAVQHPAIVAPAGAELDRPVRAITQSPALERGYAIV